MRNDYQTVSLNDALAAERTVLAAERTFLAYMRSAFTLFAAGVTGSQFLHVELLVTVSYILGIIAPLVLVLGAVRLYSSRRIVTDLLAQKAAERKKEGP